MSKMLSMGLMAEKIKIECGVWHDLTQANERRETEVRKKGM
jgi:hypothetical protein